MVPPRYSHHVYGSGPLEVQLWLDYICPFSVKLFNTVYTQVIPKLEKKYPGKVSFVFQNYHQPWHPQGGYLHEAALAVGLVSPEHFWAYSKVLFDNSSEFYDENVVNKSREQIIGQLVDLASPLGINTSALHDILDIKPGKAQNAGPKHIVDVKYFTKLGRQTGIHVTPSVLVGDIFDGNFSSSLSADEWLELLGNSIKHFVSE